MTPARSEVVPTRFRLSLLVVALVVAGCQAADGPEGDRAVPEPTTACGRQDSVIGDDSTREGRVEEADVDGDDVDDAVRLHVDDAGSGGCRAFLVVELEGETLVTSVWEVGEQGGLPQPSILGFADIDAAPGYEVLINEASGASTQFAAAYDIVDGELVRLHAPDTSNDLLAFGGSVGHIEAVDCSADLVVVSQAVPGDGKGALERGIYEVTRRTYEVLGGSLQPRDVERREVPIQALDRFAEFGAGPFGSCPAP